MTALKDIEGIYFVGIGGIGMSALALYFSRGGFIVGGYDRSETALTNSLSAQGCFISYKDDVRTIPSLFTGNRDKKKILVVYTPAVPHDNRILSFFIKNHYLVRKRSEILGEISTLTDTLAVAGTHGKTTISTMIAHLLKQSHVDCSAFLGGISKNYNSNLLVGEGKYTVMEADEFDRSFHRLKPLIAVITSVDADHLDIYGNHESMIKAYNEFCTVIRPGGKLVINNRIKNLIAVPEGIEEFTYGFDPDCDYRTIEIKQHTGYYTFNIKTPDGILTGLHFPFPGLINIENLTAAVAVAVMCGVTEQEIRKAILLFQGVKRRFDIRLNMPGLTYIDDYAHHPEEIRACIRSVREFFPGRKITGIFQPHLFSRTQDHAAGFAETLDELDEVILLPVYPARERPVPGVTSRLIFDKMKMENKRMMEMNEITGALDKDELDVLITIGAGDIDKLIGPIERKLKDKD